MSGYVFSFLKDRDGAVHVWLACPKCGKWAELDADQLHGRVSAECPHGCGFHETADFYAAMDDEQKKQAEATA